MNKLRPRQFTGTLVFAFAVGLFGAPSSPTVEALPTVGGAALAYAPPCTFEHFEMIDAWLELQEYGGWYYEKIYEEKRDAYYDCLYG